MPLRVSCNLNLPKSVPQHYHMDGVFAEDFMIANVAVVDTDLVNGAIGRPARNASKVLRVLALRLERRYRLTTCLCDTRARRRAGPHFAPMAPRNAEQQRHAAPDGRAHFWREGRAERRALSGSTKARLRSIRTGLPPPASGGCAREPS